MSSSLQLKFLASTNEVGKLPPSQAEIAFIGRSNVGKSSLLNALSGGQSVARVSGTPGRTQTLDLFLCERGGTVVDCPGFGYAKVSKSVRAQWLPMLERYLLERQALKMVLLLVDGEIGPTASDLHMLDWLRQNQVPHCVIATKHDKVKSSKRLHRHKEVAASCQLAVEDVLPVSAAKNMGIQQLSQRVRQWLGKS